MRKNIFRKSMSVILAILMLIAITSSFSVLALDVDLPVDDSVENDAVDPNIVKGVCGTAMNLTWTYNLSTNVLTISGNGAMKDRTASSTMPWKNYVSSIKTVVIESSVTKIGKYAFYSCTALQTVIYCGTEDQWSAVTKGAEWKPSTVGDALLHSYTDGVCNVCGFECAHNTVDSGSCTVCGMKMLVLGDVDGDEEITNADVLAIYRYIYDPVLYPINVDAGDVDGDGEVTNADILEIYRYIYDPTLYPIG